MIDYDGYCKYLEAQDYSLMTKKSYLKGLKIFEELGYKDTSIENCIKFKNELITKGLKGASVNARVNGMNSYLKFIGNKERIKEVKIIREPFLTDELTYREYRLLIDGLMRDRDFKWYIVIKLLATTGMRIGEACGVTFGDVRRGKCMVYGKGKKPRMIYFSDPFRETIFPYTYDKKDEDKVIPHSPTVVRNRLLLFKERYKLNCKCSPHEFRRFFAREVFERTKDLELVRGLLGHEDIKVTSRYIRKGEDKAKELLTWTVTW